VLPERGCWLCALPSTWDRCWKSLHFLRKRGLKGCFWQFCKPLSRFCIRRELQATGAAYGVFGLAVGVSDGVPMAVGVSVAAGVSVSELVAEDVGVLVGKLVAVGDAVSVAVAVSVSVAVGVTVEVGVSEGV
jgi:hypothetical protein